MQQRKGKIPLAALGAVLLATSLAACSNLTTLRAGRNFDYVNFANKVEPGVTTSAQVRQWLGAPSGTGAEVYANGAKYDVMTYYYVEAKVPTGTDNRMKLLQIKVDAQGKVVGYTWSGELTNTVPVEDKSAKK